MYKNLFFIIIILFSSKSYAQWDSGNFLEAFNEKLFQVKFFDQDHGFATGGATLVSTSDGGLSWNRFIIPEYKRLYETRVHPLTSSSIIDENSAVVVGNNGRILKTTDKGVSWNYKNLLSINDSGLTAVHFPSENTGYILGRKSNGQALIYKSTDSGETWVQLSAGEIGEVNLYQNSIYFVDEEIGFVTSSNRIYRTENGGVSWVELNNPATGFFTETHGIYQIKSAGPSKIIVSTTYYTGATRLFSSNDNGQTWEYLEDLSHGSTSPSIYLISPSFEIVNNYLYCFAIVDNGETEFLKYDLNNSTFQTFPTYNKMGYGINDLFFLNEQTLFLIDNGGATISTHFGKRIIKSPNAGLSWTDINGFTYFDTPLQNEIELYKTEGNYVLGINEQKNTQYESKVFFVNSSEDDGASWHTRLEIDGISGKLLYANGNKLIAITDWEHFNGNFKNIIYTSEDFGHSWQTHQFISSISHFSANFEMADDATLFRHDFDRLFYSQNLGINWTEIPELVDTGLIVYNYPTDSKPNYRIEDPNKIYVWGLNSDPNDKYYAMYKLNGLNSWELMIKILPPETGEYTYSNTFFSDNKAFVSLGSSFYFIVDLETKTYTESTFNFPGATNPGYLNYREFYTLDNNLWVFNTFYSGLKISYDQGQNWTVRHCESCGKKYVYDRENGELLLQDGYLKIERLRDYVPYFPLIFGNTHSQIDEIENYFVPFDDFSDTEWELLSGGNILEQTQEYAKIQWTEEGTHTLRAKYLVNASERYTYDIQITVGELGTSEQSISKLSVSPNPFSNELRIKIPDEFSENLKNLNFHLFDSTGSLVKQISSQNQKDITINDLGYLEKGIYYLSTELKGKRFMVKLIKN